MKINKPRQNAVLEALLENGCSNRELAVRFNISEETVRRHITNIFNATGYSTRTELVANELHKRYQQIQIAA